MGVSVRKRKTMGGEPANKKVFHTQCDLSNFKGFEIAVLAPICTASERHVLTWRHHDSA